MQERLQKIISGAGLASRRAAETMIAEGRVSVNGQVAEIGQTADPEKDPTATKFSEITYDEIYNLGLKVMDLTATTMCKQNNLPIYVFNMDVVGNLKKVMEGENIGTYVHN